MAIGGPGSRHGQNLPQRGRPQVWMCPACRTNNTSVIEEGCPACGAGTKEENDRATREAVATHRIVNGDELVRAIVVETLFADIRDVPDPQILDLAYYSPAARTTILRALTAMLDTPAEADELPRAVIRAWALRLAGETTT